MIPNQLQKEHLRFVKVESKGKKPFEKDWTNKPYSYNSKELLEHINKGGNYGIIGGFGNLIVLDFDNELLQTQLAPKLPETFTIKSGGGLLHKYFYTDKPESFKLLDKDKNTLMDIQGIGKMVVSAGSTHPNNNTYKVFDESEITTITIGELKALLEPWMSEEKKPVFQPRKKNNLVEELKGRIKISQVLSEMGVSTNKNPTECPFHSSKGGKCLSYDDSKGIFNCFHCETAGDIFTLYEKQENKEFKDIIKILAKREGLEKEEINKVKKQNFDKIKEEVIILLLQNKRAKATECMVQDLKTKEHIYTTRDDENSEVWIYNEGIYVPQGKTYIQEYIRKILGPAYTTNICNQVISKIEVDTYIEEQELFKDNNINILPVNNGLLNLKTKELNPFDPTIIYFNKLPLKYNKNNNCHNIIKFFKSLFKDKNEVKVVQEIFGFLLYKDYFLEKAFMFLGGGRNGKGKLLELMKRFLGIDNCAEISLNDMEKDLFAISGLFKKMANLSGDLSKTALKETGTFKKLTGRDLISAARKFKTRIQFQNYAKMIFACNELPITYDLNFAFFNRWIIIDFPFTFITQQELKILNDKTNFKLQDPDIIKNIISDDEMSGLLNWSLEGLDRIRKQKSFSYSPSTQETKIKWLRLSDSFNAFLMDCVEEDYDNSIIKEEFKQKYVEYCRKNKLKISGEKAIKTLLSTTFGAFEGRKVIGYDRKTVWLGIKFKENGINNNGKGDNGTMGISTYRGFSNSYIDIKKGCHPNHPCISLLTEPTKKPVFVEELVLLPKDLKDFRFENISIKIIDKQIFSLIKEIPENNAVKLDELFLDRINYLVKNGEIEEIPAGTYRRLE